jgi:isoleucyl-tRNA synthetase
MLYDIMQNTQYDPKRIEKDVQQFWKEKRIPEKITDFSSSGKSGRRKFYLLDGPPYVNGIPHVGHVKTTTFKDVWGKFKHMQGYSVWFQPGFDCSGLPIENAVEKNLGIKSKKDIEEKIGLENFIKACRELAEQNLHVWMNLYKSLGAWRGWQDPYLTYKDYYLESGWWTVKRMHEKGLLEEGTKPSFWCPHCQTVLSGYEVTDSYKNLEDTSIFIKFPVKPQIYNAPEYFLVWTTTPWTLPANVAICVHPDETYVRAIVGGDVLILAEKRLEELHRLGVGYKVLEKFRGKKLEGMAYEPVLDVPLQHELDRNPKAHKVILSIPIMKKRVASKTLAKKATKEKDEFSHVVDMETGSGIVHIAPGHGEVDNRLGKHYKLPEPSPVDDEGKLTREAGKFGEHFVKKADPLIIETLEKSGRLLMAEKITHSYPLCWRCKSPLIYRMSSQWFLRLDPIREKVLRENRKVNWLPDFGKERFSNLIQEAPDWAITRQRYWGIPIPIWVCEKCNSRTVIGSKEELEKLSGKKLTNIHKDVVDKILLKCHCGGRMERVKDIMDVWFDSGISPWASIGYPFRNKGLFEGLWPVDLIDESQDQIRGWFYSLMLCGVSIFDKSSYRTVCLNGWTLDEKGEKMSKSLGNVMDAGEARNLLGSDLLRLYYCYDTAPWETQKFSMTNAKDLHRVMNVFWNTYMFIDTYCRKGHHALPEKLNVEDKWILSRINTVTEEVTVDMENFRFNSAARTLADFMLNDFSRKYIKLIRNRVSPWYEGEDKTAAQASSVYVLEKAVRLMAPFTPFISEKIYMDFFQKESVHLEEWPEVEKSLVKRRLEEEMVIADSLIEGISSARQEAGVKLKWPILEMHVHPKDKRSEEAITNMKEIIQNMGNVRNVHIAKKLPISSVKEAGPPSGGIRKFEHGEFALGEVLMAEALVRELVRKIQMLRKEEKLKVTQRISLVLETDKETQEKLHASKAEILEGVGAGSLEFQPRKEGGRKLEGAEAPSGKGSAFGPESAKGSLEFEGAKVRIWFEVNK